MTEKQEDLYEAYIKRRVNDAVYAANLLSNMKQVDTCRKCKKENRNLPDDYAIVLEIDSSLRSNGHCVSPDSDKYQEYCKAVRTIAECVTGVTNDN